MSSVVNVIKKAADKTVKFSNVLAPAARVSEPLISSFMYAPIYGGVRKYDWKPYPNKSDEALRAATWASTWAKKMGFKARNGNLTTLISRTWDLNYRAKYLTYRAESEAFFVKHKPPATKEELQKAEETITRLVEGAKENAERVHKEALRKASLREDIADEKLQRLETQLASIQNDQLSGASTIVPIVLLGAVGVGAYFFLKKGKRR